MTTDSLDPPWMRRTKWLTQALLISGTLNIAFIATFAYFVLKDKKEPVTIELKPAAQAANVPLTNDQLLRAYSTLSFQDLLLRLENKELVEVGYSKRDLALSCLVAFHNFNLERALGGLSLQQRKLSFSSSDGQDTIDLIIFPGLADYQYQAIMHYAKTEKWPFTSKGLFFELKRLSCPKDPTLLEAFYLTPEYHAVSVLFGRCGPPLAKSQLIDLLCEGDWNTLHEFTEKQRCVQDLSLDAKRNLLLSYLAINSQTAANMLLETEREFISKRLDDNQVLLLFDLLKEKTSDLEAFSKEMLASPRSDAVLKRSAEILYCFVGEAVPNPLDHKTALLRFLPELVAKEAPPPVLEKVAVEGAAPIVKVATPKETKLKTKAKKKHIVQEGDNLWKISRKYKVSIEAIMKANRMETEKLRPGKELEIP